MAKFKVGDRVKIVGRGSAGRRDRIGQVAPIQSTGDGGTGWDWQVDDGTGTGDVYPESSLELAPSFKVGDEVRVKAGSPVWEKFAGKLQPSNGSFGVKLAVKSYITGLREVDYVGVGSGDIAIDAINIEFLEPWNPAEEWDGSKWVAKKVASSAAPHIVIAKNSSGKLTPATNPYVHDSQESAKAEAKRLAEANKGQEFCVYGLKEAVTVEEPKPKFVVGQRVKIIGGKEHFLQVGSIATVLRFRYGGTYILRGISGEWEQVEQIVLESSMEATT